METSKKQNQEENRKEDMEKAAKEFDKIAGTQGNCAARKYLEILQQGTRTYISNHEKYGWRYKAVMHMHG
jgi:hypothetical protein